MYCTSCHPTNGIKALKGTQSTKLNLLAGPYLLFPLCKLSNWPTGIDRKMHKEESIQI